MRLIIGFTIISPLIAKAQLYQSAGNVAGYNDELVGGSNV